MRSKRALLLLLMGLSLIAGITVIIIGLLSAKTLVSIDSDPKSEVYIDEVLMGNTPIDLQVKSKDVLLKLVPISPDKPLLPYELALSLTPHTKIIVRRIFNEKLERSSFQLLKFEKNFQNKANITVVSDPPKSEIFASDSYIGDSPVSLSLPPSTYSLIVSKDGYESERLNLNAEIGMNLVAFVGLSRSIGELASVDVKKPETATILKNSLGFLRVRKEPNGYAQDIARVEPGREYQVLGYSSDKKWINIQVNASENGWILGSQATVSAYVATPP